VVIRPLDTTQPRRLIRYGYDAVTVTFDPIVHGDEQARRKSVPGFLRSVPAA
jgi:hypothetical protein